MSKAIGRIVKFTGTAGVIYEKMGHDEVIVSLKNRPKVRNHIGQIHAAAMVLLAETASGMALGMHVPDDKLPLMKSLQSKFIKKSQGAIRARAWLSEEQIGRVLKEEKGDINISVELTDESGEAPVICEMVWAWVPKKKRT